MEHLKILLCLVVLTSLVVPTAGIEEEFPLELSYGRVLERYVGSDGFVDYQAMKAEPKDLEVYLKALDGLEAQKYESFSKAEKVAFWINAYNALTLKVIIDHYPIESSMFKSLRYPKNSIRQIPGVWSKITFSIMGENLSLNHIEHEILRKKFEEPRIHMALVCAARGCPPLRQEPFNGKTIEAQLDDQSRKFLADPQKFYIDELKSVVFVSSIFKWFGKDFLNRYSPEKGFEGQSKEKKAVLHFISLYIPENQRNYLVRSKYKVKYIKYDWTLNERVAK
jgi:hypothetical protein